MAHDVFISYSSPDKPAADAACAALEAKGVRCWMAPRDIKPSQSWAAAIVEAIRGARIFLLVFSRHANESDQVQREVERAANSGKQLLTLRVEDVLPKAALEYYLNTPHWLDAITPPIDSHLGKLADACTSVLAWLDTGADVAVDDTPPIPPSEPSDVPPHAYLRATRRKWLIGALVVAVVAVLATGGGLLVHHVLSSTSGGELVLTAATDPGTEPFMPPAASPLPSTTQPPPTLSSRGDGGAIATQPLPGNRDGLYGGTINNAASDREQMISFLAANPPQAGAFVNTLNSDPTLYWSGGHPLTVGDIGTYLRELTPVVLRLDTRVTNHGYANSRTTALQTVLQAGTALLVDAHGVPRVRSLSGSPLTAPFALEGSPKLVGTAWPRFRSGALAEVEPATATITTFILVDIVSGQPFNRPAGTTGTDDTPHEQPIASPQARSPAPTTGHDDQASIAGTYMWHWLSMQCGPLDIIAAQHDTPTSVIVDGKALHIMGATGTLNADGSFSASGAGGILTIAGLFVNDGGTTVIHDGKWNQAACHATFTATKQ